MLRNIFKKDSKKKDTILEFKDGTSMDFDIFWLQRELEFRHINENYQFRASEKKHLKLGKIINSLFDIRKEEISTLSINDGTLSIIEDENEIWNYELLSRYKRNEKGEYDYHTEGCSKLTDQIVLTLGYRTYEKKENDKDKSISKQDGILIIHMQRPDGLKDKTLYSQISFLQPITKLERSKFGINPQPKSFSILVAYDYRDKTEIDNEFNTVFNSAKQKLKDNKISELDYLERELLSLMYHPEIGKDYFFGKKVMEESRFWDAIVYFENAFNGLQKKWWDKRLSDEEYEILIESSFYIGYCYYEIGLYDKAYKYLEFSSTLSREGYKYQSEYINCLIALHDIRSIMIIENNLEQLSKKNEEERGESDYYFYMFLIRRKAYCLIELNQLEQAKKYLKQILENAPENEFANNELEFINDQMNQ
jgi:tetratricopeptide (TPR) repeat protein